GKTSIISALDHFLGKMTVIENAALLSDEQLEEFARVLERDDRSLLIALADTREAVEEMFRRVPALSESFTAVFDGKHYTAEELLDLTERYLYEKEARLTPAAMTLVLEKAEALVEERPGNLPRIMLRFVDQALEKSERGGLFGFGAGKIGSDGILNVDAKHFRGIE
ncbi:MAG: hypothetical protein IIY77_09530, partial [Lachnospiraceae bacterium]|nr:hypothetical protein [Lachnospiraceae bacterium]